MRQTEVEQHGFAARAEHDVARLDVEMDDVLPVQIVERGRDFDADLGDFRIRQGQFGQPRQ